MFEKVCRENLIKLADGFAAATGLSLSTVGRRFHGNQAFFTEFKRGECSLTVSKYDEMVETFRAEWPKDAHWPFLRPAMISRPKGKKSLDNNSRR
jgi:hypothetical protein